MATNPGKAVASTSVAAHVKPTKETKSKKALDARKIRLQQGKAIDEEDFLSDEGKPVCILCEKTFVTMEFLHDHMQGHSDGEWKTFFAPHPKTPTVATGVPKSMEPLHTWKLTKKRSSLGLGGCYDDKKVHKLPYMRKPLGLLKLDDQDLEAADTLLKMRRGCRSPSVTRKQTQADQECEGRHAKIRPNMGEMKWYDENDLEGANNLMLLKKGRESIAEPSATKRQIQAEESEGRCAVGFAFDLNWPPPMDTDSEDDDYYL